MASPPPNPDARELPYGWIQQYNWEYRQWYYVNMREQPPRSSWEHPLGPIPQGFAPSLGPPPERSYNRSPYGDRPYSNPPPQGYGGYPSYQQAPQGYYNAPSGGYGPPGYSQPPHGNRGSYPEQQRVVYADEERKHNKKGPGMGTALLAGGAGLVGGALLMDAFDDHEEREREIGFDQGYQDGWDDNQGGFDGGW